MAASRYDAPSQATSPSCDRPPHCAPISSPFAVPEHVGDMFSSATNMSQDGNCRCDVKLYCYYRAFLQQLSIFRSYRRTHLAIVC